MNRRGFTVVELIITITVMGILLVLTVVNLSGSQAAARDSEREGDISTIQTWLENYYTTGSPATGDPGSYPVATVADSPNLAQNFPDADLKAFTAPGASDVYASFKKAANATQTTSGVSPAPTISTYVYQPINSSGGLCSAPLDCRKYNLYYRLEGGGSPIKMVTSKNQ